MSVVATGKHRFRQQSEENKENRSYKGLSYMCRSQSGPLHVKEDPGQVDWDWLSLTCKWRKLVGKTG